MAWHGCFALSVHLTPTRAVLSPRPLPSARRILLDAGASPWRQDHNYHRTCVHYAAAKNHANVIKPVLDRSLVVPQFPGSQGRSNLDDSINRYGGHVCGRRRQQVLACVNDDVCVDAAHMRASKHRVVVGGQSELGAVLLF